MGRLRVRGGCAKEQGAAQAQCRLPKGCFGNCSHAFGSELKLIEVEEQEAAERRGPVVSPGPVASLDTVPDAAVILLAVAAVTTGRASLGGTGDV